MRALVLVALAGCVTLGDEAGPWEPIDTITGDLAPEVGPVPAPLEGPPPSTLRVATWNVHFGADPDELAANLAASELANVDVLMIQEIEAWSDEPVSRTRRLAEALGMTWVYAPARVEAEGATHGIALLSRFPFEAVAIRKLPFIDYPIRPRRRNALAADIVVGDRRVRVINVHLDVRIGAADRVLQVDPAVIDQPDRAIVGGDFNTNPWAWLEASIPLTGTEAIVGMEQAIVIDDYFAGLDFTGALAADVSTFRVPGLGVRADDIYARGYSITDAGVAFVDGSDHWPVWTDILLIP
ncbi:MAG: endonuclease/exonuclease/phosphatase family protein [Deltaproteobacteria bacterium]|nr:endonuclease/exonuclease/phosphatase family protein [Deltaproteobacteria bacterium]